MNIPTTTVVRVNVDGTTENNIIAQSDIHKHIEGDLTFLGAIPELNSFIVGTLNENLEVNRSYEMFKQFLMDDIIPRGVFFLIGSDDNGNEIDIFNTDLATYLQYM